jgi:prepilin-type N-terminal cleavage/methylation domain-containing protein
MSMAARRRRTVPIPRRRWWRLLPDREGFSLVEILVVLGILVIGVLPLAVFQSQARRDVSRSDRYTQAITLAQRQLEEMKSLGFGNAPPDSGQVGQVQWWSNAQNIAFGLDRLTVTVVWADRGQIRTLQMADLISMR